MKTIIFSIGILWSIASNAQYSFYSSSFSLIDAESKEVISSEVKYQSHNVSFPDSLLIHNIFDESGKIIDSQIYQITEANSEGELIMFSALSGVSGNTYYYVLKSEEDNYVLLQYFQDDNSFYLYDAETTDLKTFKQ
jgi:hypothetical protein